MLALALVMSAALGQSTFICSNPKTVVLSIGTTAAPCPTTSLSGRKFVAICNSSANTGTAKLKVLVTQVSGGTAPVMGSTNPGRTLEKGQCEQWYVTTKSTPQCIADQAATLTEVVECQ